MAKEKADAQWNFQKNSDIEFLKPYIYLHLKILNIFINLALNLDYLMV